MAPEKHALLGASSAHRWINCPPSAQLCADVPDTGSPYAAEGTLAHAWCEYLLLTALGKKAEKPEEQPAEEMLEAAIGYRDFVLNALNNVEGQLQIFVEQRVDFSDWVPEGFGTVDCLAVSDGVLKVFDFKYGQGVEVDADRTPQLMCYALGGYAMLNRLYGIYDISLNIYQPRRNHISSFSLTAAELLIWAKETLEPAAHLAYNGDGDLNAGDWCRFCKVKATCRALANRSRELALLDFPEPSALTTEEIAGILPKLDLLTDWANALKDYALDQALSGVKYDGYKLVAGRSVRKFRSEADACLKSKAAGYNPYITKMKGLI